MSIQKDVAGQIKDALKAKDAVRLMVIRGLTAAFVNELVVKSRKPDGELTDDEALVVIRRSVKQRKDSIEQFRKGGREDLVDSEQAELSILEKFLPAPMGVDEIKKIVANKKNELGITDRKETGRLMAAVMKELKGKADGNDVKAAVDSNFS